MFVRSLFNKHQISFAYLYLGISNILVRTLVNRYHHRWVCFIQAILEIWWCGIYTIFVLENKGRKVSSKLSYNNILGSIRPRIMFPLFQHVFTSSWSRWLIRIASSVAERHVTPSLTCNHRRRITATILLIDTFSIHRS